MFEVEGLCKDFGELKVLKGINETFYKGDVAAIIGPSGSGKSTFIRCLNLLEQPTSGQIVFEGNEITAKGFDVNLHRQKVGMVFQQFNLFNNLSVSGQCDDLAEEGERHFKGGGGDKGDGRCWSG